MMFLSNTCCQFINNVFMYVTLVTSGVFEYNKQIFTLHTKEKSNKRYISMYLIHLITLKGLLLLSDSFVCLDYAFKIL